MKLAKQSNYTTFKVTNPLDYLDGVEKDLSNLFTAFKGRIRLGNCTDGSRGENIEGEFQVFTTSATPNAENTISHTLGTIPIGRIIVNQDKAGSLYKGTIAWTSTNVYFKCDVASVTFGIFLLK